MKNNVINNLVSFGIFTCVLVGIIGCIVTLCSGCTSQEPIIIDGGNSMDWNTNNISKTNGVLYNKIALICSLTKVDPNCYGGWDGNCPGTDVDAKTFKTICNQYDIPCVKLENSQCTAINIINQWKNCIAHLNPTNGLFIFYYSGHGGQVYGNEEDGLDETLCFWDGQFRDDDVWKLINLQPKTTRCFMVTDCCNSGSNYQLPFNIVKSNKKIKFFSRSQEPNLLHYGGCNDGEYSYGSSRGGVFTQSLLKTYSKDSTYIQWFNAAQKDTYTNQGQKPTFAETGISFKNKKIFE